MYQCNKCDNPILPGGKGTHNQRLCTSCWADVLELHEARIGMKLLASTYGVSINGISRVVRKSRDLTNGLG